MKHNETHAVHDALVDLFNDLVGDKLMAHVAPPDHNVGIFQHFVGQAVFRLFHLCSAHLNFIAQFADDVCNGFVQTVRMLLDGLLAAMLKGWVIVKIFVPDSDSNHVK